MSVRRTIVLGSLVCASLTSACTSDSKTSTTGDGGDSNVDGGGGDAGGDAEVCPAGGEGTLSVAIAIAADVDADVLVDGKETSKLTASDDLTLPAGEHTLTMRRVTVPGDVVGRAYSADGLETTNVCVKADATTKIDLKYTLEPGSEHLWVLGGDDYHAASYAADVLEVTGEPDPSVTLSGGTTSPTSLAFDRAGTLWIADATGKLLGYQRDSLGASQDSAPEVVLTGSAVCAAVVPCGPRAIAFDAANDMWLAMPKGVVRISRDQLTASGEPEVSSTLSGESVGDPQALAFDKEGALWIANGLDNTIVSFAAARLGSDDSDPADSSFYGQTPSPVISDLGLPTALAFDADDNLWAGYFGPNVIARYTPTDRGIEGALTPAVQLKLGVLALVEGMAFDDASNLWLTGKQGHVIRLAASALDSSTSDLSAELVTLTVQGYAQDLAFNPPAANTPLVR